EVQLVGACPHCQRTNVRNRSSIVVPGYCTSCGGFLGDAQPLSASPEDLWTARQIGLMLQGSPGVESAGLVSLLESIVVQMGDGRASTFAGLYGFSKSGI